MSTTISRADLIRLDAQDGSVDGTVSEQQLTDFNQEFSEKALQENLFNEEGLLDYGRYLDSFGKGWAVWKGFTQNPEDIPLLEALKLGQKTSQIKKEMHVGFRTDESQKAEAIRRLKDDYTLFDEMGLNEKFLDSRHVFRRLLMYGENNGDPQLVFQNAATQYFRYLGDKKLLDPDSKLAHDLDQKMRKIDVYEKLSPVQEENYVWSVSAALAYRTLYFFPAVEDRVWGGAIQSINLNFGTLEMRGLFMELANLSQNPFVLSKIEASTEGSFDPDKKRMQLPLHGIAEEIGDSQYGRGGTLLHELGHAIWAEGYSKSLSEWFGDWVGNSSDQEKVKNIIRFFHIDLVEAQFEDVFGSDYGHPDSELRKLASRYDPVNETHSALLSLTELGFNFPEIIRERLEKNYWSPEDVQAVYGKLAGFREIIQEEWGFKGSPYWANASFCRLMD